MNVGHYIPKLFHFHLLNFILTKTVFADLTPP